MEFKSSLKRYKKKKRKRKNEIGYSSTGQVRGYQDNLGDCSRQPSQTHHLQSTG